MILCLNCLSKPLCESNHLKREVVCTNFNCRKAIKRDDMSKFEVKRDSSFSFLTLQSDGTLVSILNGPFTWSSLLRCV